VILGNGGAARAVVAGCAQLGCAEIHIIGRNQQNLEAFQNNWNNSPLAVNIQAHLWEKTATANSPDDSTSEHNPKGMYPHIKESPLNAGQIADLPPGAVVYDPIYNPSPTQFLQHAQQQGAVTINGLEMLVQQGARLKIWLQQEVPVDIMRQALQQQLGLK
jgi:shikimate dehydrogenase